MKKYFIKTFGCQMNESDSERIEALLKEEGLLESNSIETADLAIYTTCGVRQTAEDRVYGQVHNLRKKNPKIKIVITGCLAHRKDVQRKLKEKADFFIPIADILSLREIIKNNKVDENQNGKNEYLELVPNYHKRDSAFVPIMTGCNNFCTYCVVPYARGREWSRPMSEIVAEIESLAKNNYKSVMLLGQNVNSYDYSTETEKEIKFPFLLDALASKFPEIQFSFFTSHPKDFSKELMDTIAKNKNISREIHLPFQSGSDKILKAMNRKYTQKHYLSIIEQIKKKVPDAKFSTDVIVGFPGETKEDFEKTADVFRKVKFFEAYVNKYSPRPGTAAEKLEDSIPWEEKKRREKFLRTLF